MKILAISIAAFFLGMFVDGQIIRKKKKRATEELRKTIRKLNERLD